MHTVIQNIIRFVLLVLFQVLVLNNIEFLGYVNPFLYILFILSLPVHTPRWFTLLLAFVLGLTIDAFSNTMGMHAFATVLAAFFRGGIINLFITIEEGNNPTPSFHSFGLSAYLKYLFVIVLIHHATLFLLEAFSLLNFWILSTKIILSSLVTIILVVGFQLLNKND
jgi:rod shape-determining protein MreD